MATTLRLCPVILFALFVQTVSDESVNALGSALGGSGNIPTEGWVLSVGGYTTLENLDIGETETLKGSAPVSFSPAFVEFVEQPLCNARHEVVVIKNNDKEKSLRLYGISSKSEDVYCTWFDHEDIEPGENTSFVIVHLGRSMGRVEVGLTLSTSFGELTYQVYASSILNPTRAKPLLHGRIPVGVTYAQPITVYNPIDTPIGIAEIYTSTDLLELEPADLLEANGYASNENWVIGPRESKDIMLLTATAAAPGLIQGYVHVLTNSSEGNSVVAVRIEVLEDSGLYHGPGDSIEFGSVALTDDPQKRDITILSNTDQTLRIIDATVHECINIDGDETACPNISIQLKRMNGLMKPKQFTVIGEAVLTPSANQPNGYFQGSIGIDYTTLDDETFKLHLPFFVNMVRGSLRFPNLASSFHVAGPPYESQVHEIFVRNDFAESIMVSNVLVPLDYREILSTPEFQPFVISPNSTISFNLGFLAPSSDPLISTELQLDTNASDKPYMLPVHSYNARLSYSVGGESDEIIEFGQINLGEKYTTTLELVNYNPVIIPITYFSTNLDTVALKFQRITDDESNPSIAEYGRLYPDAYIDLDDMRMEVPTQAQSLDINLLPGQKAVFILEVEALTKQKAKTEVEFGTPYEEIRIPLRYSALKHSLSIQPKSMQFAPIFPGQLHDPARRKASKIKHLIPLERKTINLSPINRLDDITNVYSDDPRLIIHRVDEVNPDGKSVTLATVEFDPTMGSWAENYAPQIFSADGTLGELTPDITNEVHRAQTAWKRLVQSKRTTISSKIFVDSISTKTIAIEMQGSLEPLQLSMPSGVNFPLTQIRHVTREVVSIANPSQYPILLNIVSLKDFAADQPLLNSLVEVFEMQPGDVDPTDSSQSSISAIFEDTGSKAIVLPPFGQASISIEFRPQTAGSLSSTLFIRNNLTAIQAISVTGEAGRGTFGFPKSQPFFSDDGLLFPLTNQNLSYCKLSRYLSPGDAIRRFTFNVTVVNRGNMPVTVENFGFGEGSLCASSGFSLDTCESFVLRPKRPKIMSIHFQPDFTTAHVRQSLIVHLEGLDRPLKFNIAAVLPQDFVESCFDSLPGPQWEGRFKLSVIIGLLSLGGLIFTQEYAQGTWGQHAKKRRQTKGTSRSSEKTAESIADASPPASGGDIEIPQPMPPELDIPNHGKNRKVKAAQVVEKVQDSASNDVSTSSDDGSLSQGRLLTPSGIARSDEEFDNKKVESSAPATKTSNNSESKSSGKPKAKSSAPPPVEEIVLPKTSRKVKVETSSILTESKLKHDKEIANLSSVLEETESLKEKGKKLGLDKEKAKEAEKEKSREKQRQKAKDVEKLNKSKRNEGVKTDSARSSPVGAIGSPKFGERKKAQMPTVPKPEAMIAEAQARALASNSRSVVESNFNITAKLPKVPGIKSVDESISKPVLNSPEQQIHLSNILAQNESSDWIGLDKMQGASPFMWEKNDDVLPTTFGSDMNGSDWTNTLLSMDNYGDAGSSQFLASNILAANSHGPGGSMAGANGQRRPPGLAGPPGLSTVSVQQPISSVPNSNGDLSGFAVGDSAPLWNPRNGMFSDPLDPSSNPQLPMHPSTQPPPGLGTNWGSAIGSSFQTSSEPAYSNMPKGIASLPSIPSIPNAEKDIWGSAGQFGDLDWAKPEQKKMNPDASDWPPSW